MVRREDDPGEGFASIALVAWRPCIALLMILIAVEILGPHGGGLVGLKSHPDLFAYRFDSSEGARLPRGARRGQRTVNVVPWPSTEDTEIVPP